VARFEIFTGDNRQFYFQLRANNGEKIFCSKGYSTKNACQSGVDSVKDHASDDDRYGNMLSPNSKPYFVLTATNGQVIGWSEPYESSAGRDRGIAYVKREAVDAFVAELV
jgi:uncharacterized protein